MVIREIRLKDYRNYGAAAVRFDGGINLLLGKNAQGKTNLLEAVYLCSLGKSARTPRDKELIMWGKQTAAVELTVSSASGDDSVKIILDKSQNKRVAINGVPISRMGELMGVCRCVFFSPDELRLIKEGPSERRRFMDIALCQISRQYFYALNNYNKALAQRNKLLKTGGDLSDTLDIWDEQLATAGARIIKSRRGFVSNLNLAARENHAFLTEGKEVLSLEFESIAGGTVDEIRENFLAELRKTRAQDIKHSYTGVGAHKDDISILIGTTDVRSFGSQGQQRTASLSLKLAETDIIKAQTGELPILLLDDVLSELDIRRCSMLLERISNIQCIITAAHLGSELSAMLNNPAIFNIQAGNVHY